MRRSCRCSKASTTHLGFHRMDFHGFSIDVPGYVTQRVQLAREGEGGVSILSEITNGDGQLVARLVGHLPAIPEPGEPWIAWGEDLNEQLHHRLQPHEIARHMQKGIGRRAMQKVLGLLYHLGVNGLEMRARLQGLAFMPHIGFDFADQQTRERIATAFYRYLLRMEYSLSPQKEEEFSRLRHAWQFVDFQLDDGTHVGREFFDYYGRVEQGHMRLIFWLQPDYTGWRRLFRRQLKHLEEGSAPSVQEVWDRRHAVTNRHHLVERLTELVYGSRPGVQASLLHDPDVPVRIREQFAGLADLALYFEGEARAARKHADHDSMTGLLNKRALLRHNRELEIAMESQRSADSTNDHWVLMIDIDHFKLVNDRHGHLVGDIALQRVARILERVAREYDLVCRYGGEEFCIVLRHAGREGVRRVAESIRAAVESEPVPTGRGSSVQITTSVGASPFRVIPSEGENGGANPFAEENDEPTSLTASIHDADQALYRAKHGGRNRVVYSV